MFMIVMIHVLGYGGVRDEAEKLSREYNIAWLMNTASYCAVNCYAMISGYAGLFAEHRLSRLINLWFRVLFYTLSITSLTALMIPNSVGVSECLKAIFPVMSRQYWYFTAYIGLFFFMPFLNFAVNHMPEKILRESIIGIIFVFSFMQTFFYRDVFGTSKGFSVLWLMIMYVSGAYFRRSGFLERLSKSKAMFSYVMSVLIAWASKLVIEALTIHFLGAAKWGDMFTSYTSPFMICSAICIMSFCLQCRLSSWGIKAVKFFAPLTFSVYLIHLHRFVLKYILMNRFSAYLLFSPLKFIVSLLLSALSIYVLCSLIDLLRIQIFRILRLEFVSERIEKFLLKWRSDV